MKKTMNSGRNPHVFGGVKTWHQISGSFSRTSFAFVEPLVANDGGPANSVKAFQPPKAGPPSAFTEFAGLPHSANRGVGW